MAGSTGRILTGRGWAALGAAAVAGLGIGLMAAWPAFRGGAPDPCAAGQVAGGDVGGPFTLVDASGETVTDRDVLTAPTVLYFGYTFCPDMCPLDMARNAEAVRLLEERGIEATPVFISIDPARDTPEVVGEFATRFHPRAVGLTGTPEQVAAASRAYRTSYAPQPAEPGDAPDTYLVGHSTFSYLALPEIGFVDFVNRDEPPEAVADRLQCFAEAAGLA